MDATRLVVVLVDFVLVDPHDETKKTRRTKQHPQSVPPRHGDDDADGRGGGGSIGWPAYYCG